MADFLFSVGADLSQLATDLNRLRELAAGITLPTGLDRGITQANTSLRTLSTTAAGAQSAMRGATQSITSAGQAAEQAAVRTNKFLDQQRFVLRTMEELSKRRVGDLGVPSALREFQRLAGVLQDIDRGLISNKKNLSPNEFKRMQLAATELTTAMRRLGTEGLANVRALNDEARLFERLLTQRGNAEARDAANRTRMAERALADIAAQGRAAQALGRTQAAAAAEDVKRTQAQAKAVQDLGKLQSAAASEDAKRVQASGRIQAQALKENEARLTQAQAQAKKLGDQLSKLQGFTFGAPKGTEDQIKKLEEALARIAAVGPLTKRSLNEISNETDRLSKARGVTSVFDGLGASMLRAVKVGAQFTLIYGAMRAAIGGVQELVALDKQMTNIASTITDAGQRAKTLPVAFDLTREAMTSLGLSAEKAGGLVFELQKVFDGNAQLMRAAFIPALVLTANKEADQAETVRVLVGAYNLYGDTLQGAGTAQEKFTKLSDMLLKSSFLSVASVQDLATALGSVAATGRQSGVSFSQLLGVLVVLSDSLRKSGQSGAGLNRTFEALLDNAQHAANIFDLPFDPDRGLKPFETLLQILEHINAEVERSGGTPTAQLAQKISQAFPTIQSRQTILTLAGQTDKIREVAKEAEGAAGVTTTAFGELQKAISAAAASLFNEFLTGFAAVTSAISGDAPGKFENLAGIIRVLGREVREAAEWFERLARFAHLGGGNVFDIFGVGSADRERFNDEVEDLRRRSFPGGVSSAGTISDQLRERITPFSDTRLGPFRPANFANTLRIHQETLEEPSQRIQRLVNDAVNEIFEEARRNDPTLSLPTRLRDAIEQQQKSEAALRQGRAAPGKLGKDEAAQIAALSALGRDAASDRTRRIALDRELRDFRQTLDRELRLGELETFPGGSEEKFAGRLDIELEAEKKQLRDKLGLGAEYNAAVVRLTAIRNEKLRQFRIDNENAEIESITRQLEAFRQATETENTLLARSLRDRVEQATFTEKALSDFGPEAPKERTKVITDVVEKQLGVQAAVAEFEQLNATVGKFGPEATEAAFRAKFLSEAFLKILPPEVIAAIEAAGKKIAFVTEETRLAQFQKQNEDTERSVRAGAEALGLFGEAADRVSLAIIRHNVSYDKLTEEQRKIIDRAAKLSEDSRQQQFRKENVETEKQIRAAAASFGLYGEEAERASLAIIRHGESYDKLTEEQRNLIDRTAKLTMEFRQQQAVLSLMSVGYDELTAKMIVQRNEASQKRASQLEEAAKQLKDFNEEAERTRAIMLEITKQRARSEGDIAGFFVASLQKSAGEAGGLFKGIEDLATDTARNMQSSFSDLFFDIFTNNAQSAGEVFKNFINSMLRSVSNFLANQLVQQLLGLLFPGQGPQQLAGPTGFSLSGITGSIKELFNGTGVAGTTVAQGPEQLAGPGFEGGAAATLPTSSGATGLGGLLAALPAIGASASALGGMLGEEGASLRKFGSLAASLGGAATLLRGIQTGNLLTGGAGLASIAGGVIGATGVGGQTGQLAGNALSSLGLLAGGPGSTLAGGLMVGNTLINAYRSFTDPNANQGTGIGGVAGTAVGGAIGAYLGQDTQSAVAGAAIGGAIGEFIGSFFGKEGVSHAEREDREVAATIDVAIAFQKSIQSATSAIDLFNKLVEGTVDSDGRGDDTPIVTRVNGQDIRQMSPQELLDAVTKNPGAVTADIIAGVAPEKLAEAEAQLAETVRAMVKALDAVKTGLARFGEVAINLTKDSGTLLDLEEIKGPFEAMREEIHDIDVELADALRNVSGLPANMDEILSLVNKRYQLELDFLKEVNDAVKAIRESIADQRTDIELQFATPAERVKIIQGQLDNVLNSLRLATDPKEIASLTQQGQGLVRDLLGQSDSLSNDFGLTQPAIKQTALHLLNQLEELSTLRLGDLSEATRDGDKEFVDFLLASAQKMGLELNLTTEQLQGLSYNAARASEALIRLGMSPAGQSPLGFARGGLVPGTGSGDTVPALLEPGEFVLPREMASMFRSMGALQFAEGGLVPSFSSRMFGNNNLQGFGNFYSNLSTMQQIAGPLQLALQLASTFTGFLPGGTSMLTGGALRKIGLLPTYNTGSFFGDMFNPYSDRGIFRLFGDLGRDIGTSIFGTSDRFATGPSGAGGLSDVLRSGMGGGFSGLDTPFISGAPMISGPASLGGFGDFPYGFTTPGSTPAPRSAPTYAPTLSSYFSQGFGDISVSGSGSAYPYGSTPSPFGGSSAKPVGGISDPYAFNIPWGYSPLTAQALGFAPWQMYEGAIADSALATGSLFGSSFSAAYGYQNPYTALQNQAWGGWMGPGVTGQGYNPYQFVAGNTTLYGGQAYRTGGQMFTGRVSASRYAEGGFVGGSGTGDIVPALLTPGEYVVPAGVAAANKTLLESLSSTGFGTPSTTTASGARNTMTRAAGTALGSLSKGISGTLVKAGTNAAGQLGDASDQIADALASATLLAMGTAMRGLITSNSLIAGAGTPTAAATATSTPAGPFSLANSWMIPGLAMPTQETVDRLNAMFGGGTGGGGATSPLSGIPPEMLRFFLGGGFAGGGFIGGPPGFDNVPIWASAGEFVVPRYAAMANAGALEHLREHGTLPGGQNVMFNLHFAITGATDPAAVAEEVEKKIEASVRTGRLGVVIAERQKRKV